MPYVIKKDDIVSFRDRLFSIYKYQAGNVTLLPVRKDSRGYVVNGNAQIFSAKQVRQKATFVDHFIHEKLD